VNLAVFDHSFATTAAWGAEESIRVKLPALGQNNQHAFYQDDRKEYLHWQR
jgi:hypothetical protein